MEGHTLCSQSCFHFRENKTGTQRSSHYLFDGTRKGLLQKMLISKFNSQMTGLMGQVAVEMVKVLQQTVDSGLRKVNLRRLFSIRS
jgi:hypothetical protein